MAQGSGRKPLVAEQRYTAGGKGKPSAAKKTARKKPVRKTKKPGLFGLFARKKTRARPAPRKRGVIGLLLAPFAWAFRLAWGFTWRIGMVVCLLVGLAVAFQYVKLPDVSAYLDGRARGSR